MVARAMMSTIPICVYTLLSKSRRTLTPATTPSSPSGTTRMTASGNSQLSYWAARTR